MLLLYTHTVGRMLVADDGIARPNTFAFLFPFNERERVNSLYDGRPVLLLIRRSLSIHWPG
jgi:hypothetical protein